MRNRYTINGDCVTIYLDRRNDEPFEVYIDLCSLDKLMSLDVKWCVHKTKWTIYARAKQWLGNGKTKSIYMHDYIMDCPPELEVDHIDHDGWNNLKSNLRVVTVKENAQNRNLSSNNTTGIRGVSFNKHLRKYEAYYHLNNKKIKVGYFDTVEKAHEELIKTRNKIYKYIG